MRKTIIQIKITKDDEDTLKEWAALKGYSLKAMPEIAFRAGLTSYIVEKYHINLPNFEETKSPPAEVQPERPGIVSGFKHALGIGKANNQQKARNQ